MKPPAHGTVAVIHMDDWAIDLIPYLPAQTSALKFHACVTFPLYSIRRATSPPQEVTRSQSKSAAKQNAFKAGNPSSQGELAIDLMCYSPDRGASRGIADFLNTD